MNCGNLPLLSLSHLSSASSSFDDVSSNLVAAMRATTFLLVVVGLNVDACSLSPQLVNQSCRPSFKYGENASGLSDANQIIIVQTLRDATLQLPCLDLLDEVIV